MNREELKSIQEKSITSDKRKLRKAYIKGERKGIKKGFIRGSIAGFALASALSLGYSGMTSLAKEVPSNPSKKAAYESFMENIHPTDDYQHYWVDFSKIAQDFDPNTMDFDSYVYGVYCNLLDVDEKTRLEDMNSFVYSMYINNKIDYSSFVLYCKARGLCKEIDGEYVIDTNKYEKALSDYVKDYSRKLKAEEELEEFKRGSMKWKQ